MRRAIRLSVIAAVIVAGLLPGQAHAYRVFVGFGFPFFAPFPYYAPPTVYYAPPASYAPPAYYPPPAYYGRPYGVPPVAYAPAPSYAPGAGAQVSTRCNAGAYICPTDAPRPIGGACSCPGNAGRLAGRVG